MGYTLRLGYAEKITDDGSFPRMEGFKVTKVNPFSGSLNSARTRPNEIDVNTQLGIEPQEYGGEVMPELGFLQTQAIDNKGKVEAEIDITLNYSPRILEITGTHLSSLHGKKSAEAAPLLMKLIAELGDDVDYDNLWNATDGNIKHLASTLLEWSFEHPDALFYSVD